MNSRLFDLNIDKFLEHWGPAEAVREIIANALDEQALTDTAPVEILREGPSSWRIRDYGRGLEPEHLRQNANPDLEPEALSSSERVVLSLLERTLALAGGRPRAVKEIRVSGTLRPQLGGGNRAMGVWEADTGRIVIHKDALASHQLFAGTLLHELAHARSGATDLTPDFEDDLTELLGVVAGNALDRANTAR